MLRNYHDITFRLGEPEWWDDNGVPRYCPFKPNECGVYDDMAALVLIECQGCARMFKVAVTWSRSDDLMMQRERVVPQPGSENFAQALADFVHYGDPPNDECCPAGPTMNSIPRRVLEMWTRGPGSDPSDWDWKRRLEFEVELDCEWAKGDGLL